MPFHPLYSPILGSAQLLSSPAGAISVALSGNSSLSAALSGKGELEASLSGNSSLSASIRGKGELQFSGSGSTSLSATLTGKGELEVSLSGNTSLTAQPRLAVVLSGNSSLSSSLTGKGELEFAGSGNTSFSGTLRAVGLLQSTLSGNTSLSAQLTGKGELEFSGSGNTSLAPTIRGVGELEAAFSGNSSLSTSLQGDGELEIALQGNTSLSATPSGKGELEFAGSGNTSFSGFLQDALGGPSILLSGNSSLEAGLSGIGSLSIALSGSSSFSGAISGLGGLQLTISGNTSLAANTSGWAAMFAALTGQTSFSGSLTDANAVELGFVTKLMRTLREYFTNDIKPLLNIPILHDNADLDYDVDMGLHAVYFAETLNADIVEFGQPLVALHEGVLSVVIRQKIDEGHHNPLNKLGIVASELKNKQISGLVDVRIRDISISFGSDDIFNNYTAKCSFQAFDEIEFDFSPISTSSSAASYDDVSDYISELYKEEIVDTLGILGGYPNVKIEPELTDSFTVLHVDHGLSTVVDSSDLNRRFGTAYIMIGVPQDTGCKFLWEICDKVYDTFAGRNRKGVKFDVPTFARVGVSGAWWQITAHCPFHVDSLEH